jgi:copper chaperone CopZ
MSFASGFDAMAKNLTKSLGTDAILKDKTVGVWNAATMSFVDTVTDVDIQIAPWTNTKPQDSLTIKIGDVLAVAYVDTAVYSGVKINKDEKIVMADETYDVIEIAKYIPQGVTVAYYVVMRLS